jgi:hypothetical protein
MRSVAKQPEGETEMGVLRVVDDVAGGWEVSKLGWTPELDGVRECVCASDITIVINAE